MRARAGLSPVGGEGKRARRAEQEGNYAAVFAASTTQNCMGTSSPSGDIVSKAENMLKTKGQKRDFSPAKAGNIMKIQQLTKHAKNSKKHDKMSL
jgi:hypothetical protein